MAKRYRWKRFRYQVQSDPANRGAIELLSEYVRTRFRMTDSPLS